MIIKSFEHTFEAYPIEQARPRAVRTNKGVRLYDPKKVSRFKEAIAYEARLLRVEPFDSPIKVTIEFYRPNQKGISQKKLDQRENKIILPIVKPDLDNYIKSFLDGLNGILWVDDNLICELHAAKYYSKYPRIKIRIEELEHES
ncbi:RusA family crossover junction endodeoxyribonuclease [Lactobacillus sp. CC-MHH1034]|uniref:RusA family crossover junction endodeoxyribonuclease n=1 Tax=Agrilactobacillus fermenti TaxID=2586909 RepID=UPI001E3FF96C|nr:RusA family crossover junction endodeoxyribonuclease [Agrilactobacillus fermenti]MCD2257405.1 RusA family crossover junction endodeoxyribonuclease [Agrilactobacillus fermenti]